MMSRLNLSAGGALARRYTEKMLISISSENHWKLRSTIVYLSGTIDILQQSPQHSYHRAGKVHQGYQVSALTQKRMESSRSTVRVYKVLIGQDFACTLRALSQDKKSISGEPNLPEIDSRIKY